MKKRYISLSVVSFYIFWTILLIGKGLGYSSANYIFQIMTWIAIIFALIKILTTKWNRGEIFICISLIILGLLVWIVSGDVSILLSIIAVVSTKNISITALFKWSF